MRYFLTNKLPIISQTKKISVYISGVILKLGFVGEIYHEYKIIWLSELYFALLIFYKCRKSFAFNFEVEVL